jgi:DNA-binding MarR family transcriptional regulator
MTGVVMPAKPSFARERAQVGIAFMDCMRVARDAHAPGVSLGEFGELLFPGVEVLVAHALDCPLTLSGLARKLELPRNTTRRRLARLIELGLVERAGDHYCWTDRISADTAHDALLAHLKTYREQSTPCLITRNNPDMPRRALLRRRYFGRVHFGHVHFGQGVFCC